MLNAVYVLTRSSFSNLLALFLYFHMFSQIAAWLLMAATTINAHFFYKKKRSTRSVAQERKTEKRGRSTQGLFFFLKQLCVSFHLSKTVQCR